MVRIVGNFFDFEVEINNVSEIEYIDCIVRHIPQGGTFPIVLLNGKEVWRGEYVDSSKAFLEAKTVRDYIINSAIKAGLYGNRNTCDEERTSSGNSGEVLRMFRRNEEP